MTVDDDDVGFRARRPSPAMHTRGSSSYRFAVIAIIVALALSACGGGGVSPTAQPSSAPQGTPTANAAASSQTHSYATVSLDATASTDSTSTIQTYMWTQTAGPSVTIQNASTASASFVAPLVSADTNLTFNLKVTDATGATANSTVSTTVQPPTANSTTASMVAVEFHVPVTGNPHNDSVAINSAPQANASLIMHIALGGAIAAANFSFVDATGAKLSDANLARVSDGALHPIDFYGTVTVPSVPFSIKATGTTGDGNGFAVTSTPIQPINMTIGLNRSFARIARGSSVQLTLTVVNSGSQATFQISANDPQGLLTTPVNVTTTIAQGATQTVPVTVTFPQTPGLVFAKLTLTAATGDDLSAQGSTTFTALLDGAP